MKKKMLNKMYTPPFTISPLATNLIAEISAQMERCVVGCRDAKFVCQLNNKPL